MTNQTSATPAAPEFDPSLVAFLAGRPRAERPLFVDIDLVTARRLSTDLLLSFSPGPAMDVEDVTIRAQPDVSVRMYRPGPPTAVIVYFHGGGWALGSVVSFDNVARALAALTGAAVLSVDYRLAPEFPFPAALDDGWAALCWAGRLPEVSEVGLSLIVAGDSAGGNVATVLARWARDRGGPSVTSQLLYYPAIAPEFDSDSYRLFAEGFGLTRREMQMFWSLYTGDCGTSTSDITPLLADLRGLPSTVVVTAELDVLRDEGEAYARSLESSGVPVTLIRATGLPHGFLTFVNDVDGVRDLVSRSAGAALLPMA